MLDGCSTTHTLRLSPPRLPAGSLSDAMSGKPPKKEGAKIEKDKAEPKMRPGIFMG